MPSRAYSIQMLRDDLLAQMRSAQRPLCTSELRENAGRLPVPGAARAFPPIREQIYRVMCGLENDGLVTRASTSGRAATWALTPAGAATDEIAALENALRLPAARPAGMQTYRRDVLMVAAIHLKAAARTARRTAASHDSAATALSHIVIEWADVITALSDPQRVDDPTHQVESAIRRSAQYASTLPASPLEPPARPS
ncbi:hypothetical protein PJI20_10030 [Mycobacterium kansasii]